MIFKEIPGISLKYSQKILSLFETFPEHSEVWLFGSRAKGNYREGSDIDLALKGSELSLQNRDDILTKYESLFLPWKLDLLLYSTIKEPALLSHIDRVGILVFKK